MKISWYSVMVIEAYGAEDFVSKEECSTLREAREFAHNWQKEYEDDRVEIWLMSIEPGDTPKYELTALM